jgi:MarR family transcriptional regulator, organic hydroperoxide resistance regulator
MVTTGLTTEDVGSAPPVPDQADVADPAPSIDELVALLFQLTGDLRQKFTDHAAELDLSFPQAMALRELNDPLPMRELAQRLCCDASNVTGIVDRLEARELVERRVAPDDRRVKHLVLTEEGRAVRESHRDRLAVDLPLLDLSPEDRRSLAQLLRRSVGEGRAG